MEEEDYSRWSLRDRLEQLAPGRRSVEIMLIVQA
jgi:hypothetical protein